jgi:hypothetical protein
MALAIADADVADSGEQLMQQGSPLLIDTGAGIAGFAPSGLRGPWIASRREERRSQ